jgi:flagellar FliL protein
MLGGGGFAGYMYFNKPAEAAAEGDQKKDSHGEDASKSEGILDFSEVVELTPLVLPIVDDSGVHQVINVAISLEVNGGGNVRKVHKLMPRITNAFLQDMYGVLNRHAALRGGALKVDMLKQRLQNISNKIVGDEKTINKVLLTVVEQRPV